MIDLHTHSKASDGELEPEALIDLAIKNNITTLAITDHDTVDGIPKAIEYAKNKKITIIPGVELEATVSKGQMHILGLFIDYKNEKFLNTLRDIKNARKLRNDKFIEEFNKMGLTISIEELNEVSSGEIIGKPHFAKVFLKKGYIKAKEEAFDKYFNQPPLNKLKKNVNTPEEIVQLIKQANGIAVLAHPQTLKLTDKELLDTIKELKQYGLDGVECYHTEQTYDEMKKYQDIAHNLNLLITKGSDFHGPIVKPKNKLGTGYNNNIVIDENIENQILRRLMSLNNNKIT